MRVQTIVNDFNKIAPTKGNEKELEIKLYLDRAAFLLFYKSIEAKYTGKYTQVLNTITDVDKSTTNRKEIYFEKNVKKNEIYIQKKQINRYNSRIINIEYAITVAEERQSKSFTIATAKCIRLKNRVSFIVKELPKWRVDFTLVCNVPKSEFSNIKTIKDNFFKTYFSVNPDYKLELEIEYLDNKIEESDISQIIDFMTKIIDPDNDINTGYQSVIYEAATKLVPSRASMFRTKFTLKQLANQPRGFNYSQYRNNIYPNLGEYWLSDKADGQRAFIYIKPDSFTIILTNSVITLDIKINGEYILDAEVILDDNPLKSKFYIFDALISDSKNVTDMPFSGRLKEIDNVIPILRKEKLLAESKIQIRLKDTKAIKEVYNRSSRLYPIDGLIFTPETPNYFKAIVFKWKPPNRQTIDFLVEKPPKSVLGISPFIVKPKHELLFLFCGISTSMFTSLGLSDVRGYNEIFKDYNFTGSLIPTAFTPGADPTAFIYYHPDNHKIKLADLKGHVAEFGWDSGWSLHNLRPDRDSQVKKGIGFGNNFKIAEDTFAYYTDPFTIDMLIKPTDDAVYFSENKQEKYKFLTKFNNFVKAQLIRQLENSENVIDLASGKGQDLFTLHGFGVKNMLFIDFDKEALAELNSRKYNLNNKQFYMFNFKPSKTFKIETLQADLTKPADDIISKIKMKKGTVNGIIMNFAIHYIIKDPKSLDNFIKLIDTYLKPGGVFIYTCFDGERIFDFIKSTEQRDIKENGDVKYSIRKHFTGKFQPYGLEVSAIHPFSRGEYYKENLLGINWINSGFIKAGYTVLQYGSFGDWLDKYKQFSDQNFSRMSNEDKIYTSLYSYITIAKN